MSYKRYEPIDPREAFTVTPHKPARREAAAAAASEAASVAASQAAFLLAIRAGVLGYDFPVEKLPNFPLPNLRRLKTDDHVKVADACHYLGVTERELRQESEPALEQQMTKVAREVYRKPSVEAVAALFEAAMTSPHPLVAVAGAAGARETTRLRPRIRSTLERAARSKDRLVSRLALAAISQIGPMESIVEKKIIDQPTSRKRRRKSSTAVITHGTFAANGSWYRPNGNFYEALKKKRPDLHVHDRSFKWTGAYSDKARRADAELLKQWVSDQGLDAPDFFAHSHGGTVANLATRKGVQFDRLVLMGWPVHEKWLPDFSNVKRVIDVRVQMDLVVMMDRGAQRFRSNNFTIEEHRNGWFDHGSTHEPAYWDDHGLWDVI
ncbi:MAG: alpha/beta fold hydrolase [Woeseiaceae bacterium]